MTAEELGKLVVVAYQGPSFNVSGISEHGADIAGNRMFAGLERAGLTIVRSGEAER